MKATQKGPKRFLCASCNYKGVKLHRMFGHWPIREFKGLDAETEMAFWKGSGTNNESLKKAVADTIAKIADDSEEIGKHGEFQPLGYWAKQGYDTEAIKRHTTEKNKRWHPVLGETYRVVIDKDKQVQSKKIVRHYQAVKNPVLNHIEDRKKASAITEEGNIVSSRLCLSKVASITAILQSLLFERSSYRFCLSDLPIAVV